MNADDFQKAESIFNAACSLPPDQRTAYVARASAGDDHLRSKVMRLLQHDAEPITKLDQSFGGAVRGITRDLLKNTETPVPARIGAYRILRQIGEGGFGVVYLAEQEMPRRIVALKVVRWHLTSPEALARFEHETHVLGQLQHAGIAQIFEAGVAEATFDREDGPRLPTRMPYYTMEYIQGQNLLRYAESGGDTGRPLDVGERLELVARVCDALQHAHQNGIIHRDLKPDNILVVDGSHTTSNHWGTGSRLFGAQPKLLDFGVARAIDSNDTTGTGRTHLGQIVGTPAYMSPEQVRGEPTRVDTRSDVYTMGVLLYQLLVGKFPYTLPESGLAAIARVIEHDPPAPLRTGGRSGPRIDADIEAIVNKALAKSPDRRYQSAAELASDLRRYLAGEPIEAKRDSALYILRKNIQRYRSALLAALVFVLLLIGFSVWASWQARVNRRLALDADRARGEAVAERDRANATAARLETEMVQSNIERGRALGLAGNFIDGERTLWTEFLARPQSQVALWALRELYFRYPNEATISVGIPYIRAMAVSPDETLVAIAGNDTSNIEVWNLRTLMREAVLVSTDRYLIDLAFSPDGKWLASAGSDGHVGVWKCANWCLTHTLQAHVKQVATLCFSSDGEWLLTGGLDKTLKIWNPQTGDCHAALLPHEASMSCARVSADGRMLATGAADGTISIWAMDGLLACVHTTSPGEVLQPVEPSQHARIASFNGHVHGVTILAFNKTGTHLASAGSTLDRTVKCWDVASGAQVAGYPSATGTVVAMTFSENGDTLYTGGWFAIEKCDINLGTRSRTVLTGKCSALRLLSDGQTLVAAGERDVRVWSLASMPAVRSLGPGSAHAVAYEPNGRYLATSHDDGSVEIRHPETGDILRRLMPEQPLAQAEDRVYRVRAISFHPSGEDVISVSRNGTLFQWNVETGACTKTAHNVNFVSQQSVTFSPDGERWGVVRRNGRFTIVDYRAERRRVTLTPGAGEALSICFSPNGELVATANRERAVRLWTLDGQAVHRLPTRSTPWGLAFSADGERLLCGTWFFTVEVWNTASGQREAVLGGHAATVWAVEMNPSDPDIFASFSSDGTVRIWSLHALQNLASFPICPDQEVVVGSYRPDGRAIAVASSTHEGRIFELDMVDRCIAGNLMSQMERAGIEEMQRTVLLEAVQRALSPSLKAETVPSVGDNLVTVPPAEVP